ncbi:MAG: hypothetical protein WCO56_06760 [Verrucomicrobiota bacterium]
MQRQFARAKGFGFRAHGEDTAINAHIADLDLVGDAAQGDAGYSNRVCPGIYTE